MTNERTPWNNQPAPMFRTARNIETDWLDSVVSRNAPTDGITTAASKEADAWLSTKSAMIVADKPELRVQAQGYAELWAGQYGTQAPVAINAFMGRLSRTAEMEYDDYFEEDRSARIRYEHTSEEGDVDTAKVAGRKTAGGYAPGEVGQFGQFDDGEYFAIGASDIDNNTFYLTSDSVEDLLDQLSDKGIDEYQLDHVEINIHSVKKTAGSNCACAKHDDGTVTTMLCPQHADDDPCATKAAVTGRRRKGSIKNGTCTNCGWSGGSKTAASGPECIANNGANGETEVPLWECPCRECTKMEWELQQNDLSVEPQSLSAWRKENWPSHYSTKKTAETHYYNGANWDTGEFILHVMNDYGMYVSLVENGAYEGFTSVTADEVQATMDQLGIGIPPGVDPEQIDWDVVAAEISDTLADLARNSSKTAYGNPQDARALDADDDVDDDFMAAQVADMTARTGPFNAGEWTVEGRRKTAAYGDSEAERAGYEAGQAAGSWVIDGNTSDETITRIMQGWDDGDPEIMDMQPSPLSGEWAGESMTEVLGDDYTDEDADDYEVGFSNGFWDEVQSSAKGFGYPFTNKQYASKTALGPHQTEGFTGIGDSAVIISGGPLGLGTWADGMRVFVSNENQDQWAIVEANEDGSPKDSQMGNGWWVSKADFRENIRDAFGPAWSSSFASSKKAATDGKQRIFRVLDARKQETLEGIQAYLPRNFTASQDADGTIWISGHDQSGWNAKYLVERLASGLHFVEEVTDDIAANANTPVEQRTWASKTAGIEVIDSLPRPENGGKYELPALILGHKGRIQLILSPSYIEDLPVNTLDEGVGYMAQRASEQGLEDFKLHVYRDARTGSKTAGAYDDSKWVYVDSDGKEHGWFTDEDRADLDATRTDGADYTWRGLDDAERQSMNSWYTEQARIQSRRKHADQGPGPSENSQDGAGESTLPDVEVGSAPENFDQHWLDGNPEGDEIEQDNPNTTKAVRTVAQIKGRNASVWDDVRAFQDARKDAKTTFEKWKGHPTGGGNYSRIPTKDVEVLPPTPGSCRFCGADKSHLTHRQEAWSDQTECSRCGGSSGYAIGD